MPRSYGSLHLATSTPSLVIDALGLVRAQELVRKTVVSCGDALVKKQLGYLLARQGVALNLEEAAEGAGSMDEDLQVELQEIISNTNLSELYLALARDLDVMEAKLPEEVNPRIFSPGTWASNPCLLEMSAQRSLDLLLNTLLHISYKVSSIDASGQGDLSGCVSLRVYGTWSAGV